MRRREPPTCSLRRKRGVKAPEGEAGETLDWAERALYAAWYLHPRQFIAPVEVGECDGAAMAHVVVSEPRLSTASAGTLCTLESKPRAVAL